MNELFRTMEQLNKTLSERIINTAHPILVPTKILSPIYPDKTDDIRVIFNDPATILIIGNRKYISKAHNEDFDEEKGLLMCLAKANGISHAKLKVLLKKADRNKNRK